MSYSDGVSVSTKVYTAHNTTVQNDVSKYLLLKHLELVLYFDSGFYIPANANFACIPEGYRPSANISVPALFINHNNEMSFYMVSMDSTTGMIKQNAVAQMKAIYIDSIYV